MTEAETVAYVLERFASQPRYEVSEMRSNLDVDITSRRFGPFKPLSASESSTFRTLVSLVLIAPARRASAARPIAPDVSPLAGTFQSLDSQLDKYERPDLQVSILAPSYLRLVVNSLVVEFRMKLCQTFRLTRYTSTQIGFKQAMNRCRALRTL